MPAKTKRPYHPATGKRRFNAWLTVEALELIRSESARLGLTQGGWVEVAVRAAAKKPPRYS